MNASQGVVKQSLPDLHRQPTLYPSDKPRTNERYKTFNQIYYTAGDDNQFEQYRQKVPFPPQSVPPKPLPSRMWFTDLDDEKPWEGYINPDANTPSRTFQYLFHKFKKGIFVQIRGGRLHVFLPFSNAHYVNEWSHRVQNAPVSTGCNSPRPVEQWVANNYMVRWENPPIESDKGYSELRYLLERVCETRAVPDIEFFLNRRDFPLLKRDGTEPYESLYGPTCPQNSVQPFSLLCSMVEREGYADVAFPTPEDISRFAQREHGHYFFQTKRGMRTGTRNEPPPLAWKNKLNRAVFRGSNTGPKGGELRIQLVELANADPEQRIDAGITSWSNRPYLERDPLTDSIWVRDPPPPSKNTSQFLSAFDQAKYKYIIHVPGHVQSYRLGDELGSGSLILMVETPYRLWFERGLKPGVHYVPIKADLSNLLEKIDWCRTHDAQCEQMAQSALLFFQTVLNGESCVQYVYELLWTYRAKVVPYLYTYPVPVEPRFPRKSVLDSTYHFNAPVVSKTARCLALLARTPAHIKLITPRRGRRGVVFQSKQSLIHVCESDQYLWKSSKSEGVLEHERKMGQHCVNSLLQWCPNFRYTYGAHENGLITENVEGVTLREYIQGPRFLFREWLFILQQIILALIVAQRRRAFVHGDLCPWNIIIRRQREQVFDYILGPDEVARVKTSCIPILIDYGRSQGIHTETHRWMHPPNSAPWAPFPAFLDCLYLLVSSTYLVLKFQKLSPAQNETVLNIFNNTLSGTSDPRYYPETPLTHIQDLWAFLEKAHVFSHLSFAPKGDSLLKLSPEVLLGELDTSRSFIFQKEYQYSNMGHFTRPDSLAPEHKNPILQRYYLQQLWLMGWTPKSVAEEIQNHHAQCLTLQKWNSSHFPGAYLDLRNLVVEMMVCTGPYRLQPQEKKVMKQLFETLLKPEMFLLLVELSQ